MMPPLAEVTVCPPWSMTRWSTTPPACPYVRGRTIKRLLVEECANCLFALARCQGGETARRFEQAGRFLFGQAGSTLADDGHLHVGPALLPEDLRRAVERQVRRQELRPAEVLESLT